MPTPSRPTTPAALLARSLRLRCPNCGKGRLFRGWFRMESRCGACGLRTERGEEGYKVGAYMFNLILAEVVWAGLLAAVVAATWPRPPWTVLLWGGAGLMIAAPLAFYPLSRALFLAFDLAFRPVADTEENR